MRGPGAREGENPALRIIFFRICHLLARCIEPIFIFDGPGRPLFKRGMNVKSGKPHWMEQYIEGFLEDFGCPFYRVAYNFVPFLCSSLTMMYFLRLRERLRLNWPS